MGKQLNLAHFSDTHGGREQFPDAVAANGRNQRGVDLMTSFAQVAEDIKGRGFPLAIHAGDVCDTPNPPVFYQLAAKKILEGLAGPIGGNSPYIRQVIVDAGNHDMPRSPVEPCYLEMFKPPTTGVPSSLHIVTQGYQVITFHDQVAAGIADPVLDDVAVHCIPHDDLKTVEWDSVQPWEGYRNILVAHGVAEGSDLYVRAVGREYPIVADVLSRNWDYVALGHWHKQTPVYLAGSSRERASRIWYSGSPDNCNYSDARDDHGKGYLDVTLGETVEQMPTVTPVVLPIRPMISIEPIDATDMSPKDLTEALLHVVQEAYTSGKLSGAVVRHRALNVRREIWSAVDTRKIRAAAASALHYELIPTYYKEEEAELPQSNDQRLEEASSAADLVAFLEERAADVIIERLREPAVKSSVTLLKKNMNEPVEDVEPDVEETGK